MDTEKEKGLFFKLLTWKYINLSYEEKQLVLYNLPESLVSKI